MPISLKFYRDQLLSTGESSSPLPAAHRLIYIRYGSVIANGATLTQDQFAYHYDPLSLQGEAELSEIWRWELSAPNETPQLLLGNRHAEPATARACDHRTRSRARNKLAVPPRQRDQRRRTHHAAASSGTRHSLSLSGGNFSVQGESGLTGTLAPGDACESGQETVVAWHSEQMPAIFIRGLLLPTDIKGEMSNIWEGDVSSPKSNWRLFVDQEITI